MDICYMDLETFQEESIINILTRYSLVLQIDYNNIYWVGSNLRKTPKCMSDSCTDDSEQTCM